MHKKYFLLACVGTKLNIKILGFKYFATSGIDLNLLDVLSRSSLICI